MPAQGKVVRVIDGDTIQLAGGQMVRYLGIDTPELKQRIDGKWVDAAEPFSREAASFNRQRVAGKQVRLEYDNEIKDRYGRLLAYVYVDGKMLSEELLAYGLARVMIIPPNTRYERRFRALEDVARTHKRGLWGAAEQGQ